MRFSAFVGLALVMIGCESRNTQLAQPDKPQATSQPPPTPKEEDAIGVDVWSKYRENAKNAESKYRAKRTEVTGKIIEVRKDEEFPPSWTISLQRAGQPGDCHYFLLVAGDIGRDVVQYAKIGHQMTIQGSVIDFVGATLYLRGDKLIRVK